MLTMSITTNVLDVAKGIKDGADQLPFAIALALTRTAQDVQTELKGGLDDHFTIRSKWVEGSIRAKPAEKKAVNPVAFVGTLYEPMASQVSGEPKKGKDGGDIAQPVWARATPSATTRPAKWPGKLAKRRNFFVAPFNRDPFVVGRGAGEGEAVGLFQRLGSKKGKRHLRLWWSIKPEVTVKDRWPFREIAEGAIARELADNFWAAFQGALASGEDRAMRALARARAKRGL